MASSLKAARHLNIAKFRSELLLRNICFGPLKISDSISQKLADKRIVEPTEIQEKAMIPILNGQDVILNSETGSGKTLCYLLPIIEHLQQSQKIFQNKILSSSCALIFAPTLELVEQIGSVCKELGQTEINIACGNSPLRVKDSTQMIITMPSVIMNYDWKSLKNIKCIVFDEADSMLVERFQEVRKILEFYMGRKTSFSSKERIRQKIKASKRKFMFSTASEKPQFVFVGATMPSGGSKTALSLIEKFVPTAKLIQSSATHKVVSNAKYEFIDVVDDFEAKFFTLATVLEKEITVKTAGQNSSISNAQAPANGLNHIKSSDQIALDNFRAIVFVNTHKDLRKLYETVTKDDRKRVLDSKYIYRDYDQSEAVYRDYDDRKDADSDTESRPIKDQSDKSTKSTLHDDHLKNSRFSEIASVTEFREKWKNRFCTLQKDMTSSERLSVIDGFAKGKYSVLITTNLASRGLDIPDVDVVVQFDFATNVAAILHRAGRTARAGAEGKVISFIAEKNKDLCQLFRSTIDKNEDVSRLFSRRRRLRQKIKRGTVKIDENIVESSVL